MTGTAQKKDEKPCRVLIIEDNDGDIFLIREALRLAGVDCDLTTFSDGEQALTFLRVTGSIDGLPHPNAVLLDMNLPKVSGMDILQAISETSHMAKVPVLVLSSSLSPSERARLSAFNVSRCLIKPADLDEFMTIGHALRELLEG